VAWAAAALPCLQRCQIPCLSDCSTSQYPSIGAKVPPGVSRGTKAPKTARCARITIVRGTATCFVVVIAGSRIVGASERAGLSPGQIRLSETNYRKAHMISFVSALPLSQLSGATI
jgi:hypothetical protein